eukprot:Hpha_TRINITY_DN16822_c0_g2::TRINITY_DN16822_c0_g2_i1::g.149732::m.149732
MSEAQDEDYEYLSRHGVGEMLEKALGELVRQRPADAKVWLACYLAGDLDASSLLSKNMILENNVADLDREVRELRGEITPEQARTDISLAAQTANVDEHEYWAMPANPKSSFRDMYERMQGATAWNKVFFSDKAGQEDTTSKDVVIVTGMQADYLPFHRTTNKGGGRCEVAESEQCAQVISAVIEGLSLWDEKAPAVVVLRDYHPMDHCTFTSQGGFEPAHCVAGSEGSKLEPSVGKALAKRIDADNGQSGVCFRRFHAGDCSEAAVPWRWTVPPAFDSYQPDRVVVKGSRWLTPPTPVEPSGKVVSIVETIPQYPGVAPGLGVQWVPGGTADILHKTAEGGLELLETQPATPIHQQSHEMVKIVKATPTAIQFGDGDVWIRLLVVRVSRADVAGGGESIDGDYHVLPGELANGMPIWMKSTSGHRTTKSAARWLYSGRSKTEGRQDRFHWFITDDWNDVENGLGWLVSKDPHEGRPPWEMDAHGGWCRERKECQATVTCREDGTHEVPSGGFFLQSAGLRHWNGTTDVDAPPDPTALLPQCRPKPLLQHIEEHCWRDKSGYSISEKGNVYLCGVPLDTKVVRTAEAIASHLADSEKHRVRIVLDACRGSRNIAGFLREPAELVDRIAEAGVRIVSATTLMERAAAREMRRSLARPLEMPSDGPGGDLKFPQALTSFMLRQVHAIRRHMKVWPIPTKTQDGGIDLEDVPFLRHLWQEWQIRSKATLSPIATIPTQAPNKRLRYGIPLDADAVCFAYPVAGFHEKMSDSNLRRCHNDPEFAFPTFGGFVYLKTKTGDESRQMQVLGCRAIMIPGTDMSFERPRKWPPKLATQMKEQNRLQKVTLRALSEAETFVWIAPGELDHAAHGAFGYRFKDNDKDCIFPVVDPDYN